MSFFAWFLFGFVTGVAGHYQDECLFTYTLEYNVCENSTCVPVKIAAAEYQRKLNRYYFQGQPPPLDETVLLVGLGSGSEDEWGKKVGKDCWPLLVSALLLQSEIDGFVIGWELSIDRLDKRLKEWELISLSHDDDLNISSISAVSEKLHAQKNWIKWKSTWPLDFALKSLQFHMSSIVMPTTLEIVVCRCREDLTWLLSLTRELSIDRLLKITVIQKCGDFLKDGIFKQVGISDPQGLPRNECSAWLYVFTGDFHELSADYLMFLQADAGRHSIPGYLEVIIRSFSVGTFPKGIGYLPLGEAQQIRSENACRDLVMEFLFGHFDESLVGGYCCGMFLVEREKVVNLPNDLLEKMSNLLTDGVGFLGEECEKWKDPCILFEQFWHVIFGESLSEPLRSENNKFPAFLRITDSQGILPNRNSPHRFPKFVL